MFPHYCRPRQKLKFNTHPRVECKQYTLNTYSESVAILRSDDVMETVFSEDQESMEMGGLL